MSAPGLRLPDTLTPEALKEALALEPRHWKTIEKKLIASGQAKWRPRKCSEPDFYSRLLAFLSDPDARRVYDRCAETLKRKRPARLADAIVASSLRMFERTLLTDPHAADPEGGEAVDAKFAYFLSPDRARAGANFFWAQCESGALSLSDLRKLIEDAPHLAEYLSPCLPDEDLPTDEAGVAERLRAIADSVARGEGNSALVADIHSLAGRLAEIVEALKRDSDLRRRFDDLRERFAKLINTDERLAGLRRSVSAEPTLDWNASVERLDDLEQGLERASAACADLAQRKEDLPPPTDGDAFGVALAALNAAHGEYDRAIGCCAALARKLFSDAGRGAGLVESPVDKRPPEGISSLDRIGPRPDEVLVADEPSGCAKPGQLKEQEPSETPVAGVSSAEAAEPARGEGGGTGLQEGGDMLLDGGAEVPEGAAEPMAPSETEWPVTADAGETRPVESPEAVTGGAAEPTGTGREQTLDGKALLDRLLRKGYLAHAYWLAHGLAEGTNADLLGAVAEAVRVKPGGCCSGELLRLLEDLAGAETGGQAEGTNSEPLLVAAVLAPSLFLDPKPTPLYELAGRVNPQHPQLAKLWGRFKERTLHRGVTVTTAQTSESSDDGERRARRRELAAQAAQFLHRVPHIGFMYAPAEKALQYIYREGADFRRLHGLVAGDDPRSLKDVRHLLGRLDPVRIVAEIHHEDGLVELKHALEGKARHKLLRHLHDSIALAQEWCQLVDAEQRRQAGRRAEEASALARELPGMLEDALSELEAAANTDTGVAVVVRVLRELGRQLHGDPSSSAGIEEAALLLPGLPLDVEGEPSAVGKELFCASARAVLEGAAEPARVFDECLERGELNRARRILERWDLGGGRERRLSMALDEIRRDLGARLERLKPCVEDAFLLGEFARAGETDEPGSGTGNRSDLLAQLQQAEELLAADGSDPASGVEDARRRLDEVDGTIGKMTTRRRELLSAECERVVAQFPDTEEGRDDREYLRATFQRYLERDDTVAATDLIERAKRAAQEGAALARVAAGHNERLQSFLEGESRYRDLVTDRERRAALPAAILEGKTIAGIQYGRLDVNHRRAAAAGIKAWEELRSERQRSPTATRLKAGVARVLDFLGYRVADKGVDVASQINPDVIHIRVQLERPPAGCPIPAFGSAIGSLLEVVLVRVKLDSAQILDAIREIRLRTVSTLVIHLQPVNRSFRLQWQQACAEDRCNALLVDYVMAVFLTRSRNRLPALFETALPYTWSQPYITKGETLGPEMFVGRSAELQSLVALDGGCIVFGGRQLGKSALLTHLRRQYHAPERSFFVAYLDIDDLGNEPQTHEEMLSSFWDRVYEQLRRCRAIEEIDARVRRSRKRLPEEVPHAILQRLQATSDARILLLLDESDDLLDKDSERDFELVRRLRGLMADTGRRFKVVFAGLQSVQRYQRWRNHPFAQLGAEVVVDPLPPLAAQELVLRPFSALGFEFENTGLVLRILSQANYHPGLIQIFCHRLLENLYRKWTSRTAAEIVRMVDAEDLRIVEQDRRTIEDIRNRFDWTLDLDDRYKVLTYALVLTSNPTRPRQESDLLELGRGWWPGVFQSMDAQSIRAVLDEMVGLGVLLREDGENVRRYRLRSPNLLRLLGPKEAIEGELERIITRPRPSRPNPRNFRRLVDPREGFFGPLTREQEASLVNQLEPFRISLVSGSPALGLGCVREQIEWVFAEAGDESREWRQRKVQRPSDTARSVVNTLSDCLRPRKRNDTFAIVDLDSLALEGRISSFIRQILRAISGVCTQNARGHLVLLLGPASLWEWVRDEHRRGIMDDAKINRIDLRRWSDGAISNALDALGLRTSSKVAGEEIVEICSGFHTLVDQGMRQVKKRSGRSADARAAIPIWSEIRKQMLDAEHVGDSFAQLGFGRVPEVVAQANLQLIKWAEPFDGGYRLSPDSFDVAEFPEGCDPRDIAERRRLINWLERLDLAHPGWGPDEELRLVPWLVEVAGALGS